MNVAEEYKVHIKANRGWAGLPKQAKDLYKARYFQPDEDYELWLDRICRTYTDDREHRGRMKQYFRNYWFHSATPVSANGGLPEKGFPVSCFVQSVEDSKEGILDAWNETFHLGSRGAGIGTYWGNVREVGAKVGANGESSGIIPFLKVDEAMTLAVSQGNLRRASKAVYLPIWHPEIEEFVSLKDATGDPNRRTPQLFTGIVIDNKFIEAVEKREKYDLISPKTNEVVKSIDAFDLWIKILEQRMTRGVPYLLFIDNVNDNAPEEYKKEGFKVETSNLCVAPETKILTKKGYVTIKDVAGTKQEIWNGEKWSTVDIFKTNDNTHLLKIETTGGVVECTDYHKFYIIEQNKVIEKRACELNVGDKLVKFELPIIEGYKILDSAYDKGIFSKEKFFVPSVKYTIQSRLEWLAGLLDSNGILTKKRKMQSFEIESISYWFLQEILMMLQTLGVTAKLVKNKDFRYRLLIGESGIQTLLNLGLKTYRLQPKLRKPNRNAEQFIKVTAVIDEDRYDETYCFTEPERHMGMFNGLNLGNCNEIVLHTAPDYSNVCILSSINLEYYDEFSEDRKVYEQFIEDVHRFLDNVLEGFIRDAGNIKGFEKVVKAAKYERSIGVGTMGLHYLFQKKGIPFDSLSAKYLNIQIFKEVRELLEQSNIKLAEEKGANPLSKKHNINRRNTHMLALAPTASISTLCNRTSPGIEPVITNVFTHKIDNGAYIIKNRYLEKLLEEKDKNTEEVWASILANGGSVQHLDFLTNNEKEVFKTAFEINQQKLIDLAADRQKYIDQNQSLNLFLKPGVNIEYIYDLHMFAWQQGIKGFYYIRSDAPKKVGVLEFKSANDIINEVANTQEQKVEECVWCQ